MTLDEGGLAWIVGASSGIGRELAKALAARGMTVVASARSKDALEELAEQAGGGRIVAKPLDATNREAAHALAREIESDYGTLALAVYCAGYWHPMGLDDLDAEAIEKTFAVNLHGAVYMLEAVLPGMRGRGSGHVALVSSVAAYRGLPLSAAYGSSKAALTYLAESLKPECDAAGIELQVVSPGFVDTPMTENNPFPMPHIISAEEAAAEIVDGLEGGGFEIHFPKRFTRQLKLLRLLPYPAFFKATKALLRRRAAQG